MKAGRIAPFIVVALVAFGCSEEGVLTAGDDSGQAADAAETLRISSALDGKAAKKGGDNDETDVSATLASINEALAASGANVRVQKAELSFASNAPADLASTVFANDRTLRLTSRWVAGDPRREAEGDKITYVVDRSFSEANAGGGSNLDSEQAIDAAFSTWDEATCSALDIVKRADTDPNPNFVLSLFFAFPTPPNPNAADITTTGFLPGFVFDLLAPNGSQSILGVTWTFIFVDANGPTDIDGNGYTDTGLKEVWYNNAFSWTDTGVGGNIDIETVALHENGHALELGHFGKVHATFSPKGGKLHVSPRAVMNAFILGTLREPLGTDNASYCGVFAAWPNPH